MSALKHSKEAQAFWTLYIAMKPEIKSEVRDMILHENTLQSEEDLTTDMMTELSMESFREIWDAPENEQWNDFIKTRLECTNKEI